MSDEQHPRIQTIFSEALELSAEKREDFVQTACRDDPALRAEVEALLAAHVQVAGGFLEQPAAQLTPEPMMRIGRYKLLQRIGEGGFGSVYMAEQQEPVVRKVALKLIKLGMDTRQVIARFEAERQALAVMDHPNIAKVFDAGASDTGRPYFVMELVRGVSITQYCDQHQLTPQQRLGLFVQVRQAVQHAHQKGIIHRDLKPSNVLVTNQDNKPVPKVIDFGIAKATQARLTEKTLFTEFRQMMGTPEYMSPEQADVNATDIDTRSDVYSLGVLLYELLTGTTPFDSKELRSKAYAEIQRIIREVEPPRPSTRVGTMGDALPSVAANRHMEPGKLGQLIRGELDWIVMKALEKDRSRRYDTANDLARDVERYLTDEPVEACPASATYRLKKFAKRNQVAVAVVSAFAMLVGSSIGLYVHGIQIEQRKTRAALAEAERQRDYAKKKEQMETAADNFLADIVGAYNPYYSTLRNQETIYRGTKRIEKGLDNGRFRGQPLVESGMREALAVTLRGLDHPDEAEHNLCVSLKLRRETLSPDDPYIAKTLRKLAPLYWRGDKYPIAEALAREAVEINRRVLPAGDPDIAGSMNCLARTLGGEGKFAEAESLYRDVIQADRTAVPMDYFNIGIGLNNLAFLRLDEGRFAEAEPLFRETTEWYGKTFPSPDPHIAMSLANTASVLQLQNKLAEGELLCREALEMDRQALPADDPANVAILNCMGDLLRAEKKFAYAEPLLSKSLEIARSTLPAGHRAISDSLTSLGLLMRDMHHFSEAEDMLREAL